MNVRGALREALEQLTAAQVPSASTTAAVLLLHVLGRDRAFLYAHPEAELTPEQERAYRHLLAERAAGKPTQYLTGRQEFWGLSFQVEPGVFIPRPETEHVVEVALAIVRERLGRADARICDVGTGSGCIALALAKELPEAEIVAVDVSEQALAVARRNAEALGLAHRVKFLHSDLLEAFLPPRNHLQRVTSHESRSTSLPPEAGSSAKGGHESRFHLIVSNPPYVGHQEAERLPREVREHEPPTALFSEDEGLAVTQRLIEQALTGLTTNGSLVIELGYEMPGRVRALLGDAWTNIEITNDLRGIPRVLAAQRK